MYTSKHLIHTRGRLNILCRFTFKDGVTRSEIGSAQSMNVKGDIKVLLNDAIYNALYRSMYELNKPLPTKKQFEDYSFNTSDIVENVEILNYEIQYYEDRVFSYKRVYNKELKKYQMVTYNNNVEYEVINAERIKNKQIEQVENNF